MTEDEIDIWEDAYELERARRRLGYLENKLAKRQRNAELQKRGYVALKPR